MELSEIQPGMVFVEKHDGYTKINRSYNLVLAIDKNDVHVLKIGWETNSIEAWMVPVDLYATARNKGLFQRDLRSGVLTKAQRKPFTVDEVADAIKKQIKNAQNLVWVLGQLQAGDYEVNVEMLENHAIVKSLRKEKNESVAI